MRIRYLVDTDWAIYYLRGDAHVVRRLEALKQDGLGLSVISLAELYEGVFSSRDPDAGEQGLTNFLRRSTLVGLDDGTCLDSAKAAGYGGAQLPIEEA
jgi:tRNA(fMet)-specific endonuclease VapC